jgi:hypothetical protein
MRATSSLVIVGIAAAALSCRPPEAVTDLLEAEAPARAGSAEPNLALSPQGTVYLTWLEPDSGRGHALKFARLEGSAWSVARTIAAGSHWFVNWADFPSLLPLDDRELAAHWLERSGAGRYAYDVRFARSSDGGETWSDPITPHRDSTASEHGFVSMWPAGDGGVGLVWLDGRNFPVAEARRAAGDSSSEAEMTLRAAVVGPDLQLSREAELDSRICDCCQTAAAVTAEGPVVAYRNRDRGEVRDIHVTRFVEGRWTASRPVAQDGWVMNACPVNGPALAARERVVVAAWFTMAGGERRVYAAFSADAGAGFGERIRIDDGSPLGRVAVVLEERGALVSWLEETARAGEVRVRRVTARGEVGPSQTVASTAASRPAGFPRMVSDGRRVVFAWTDAPTDSTPLRVRTAIATLP